VLGAFEPLADGTRWLPVWRGRALIDGGDPERAVLYLHRHLQRRPDEPWLHFHAGRAAQAKGLHRQARARFAHAAALSPVEPTFRYALGYALRLEGHLAAAAREYRRVLKLVPDKARERARVLFNLGVVERERERLPAAQRCLEESAARWPRAHLLSSPTARHELARTLYTLGVCAFERKDFVSAEAALERALAVESGHHKAHYQRALVALERGLPDAAEVSLRRALALQRDYAPAHYALGRALSDRDPGKARLHLREAVLGKPPVRRAHLDLGRLLEQLGDLEGARREYQLFARHYPDRHDWVQARLDRIEARRLAARASE
jgi:tetratricopeptide (TPR) repeat protein